MTGLSDTGIRLNPQTLKVCKNGCDTHCLQPGDPVMAAHLSLSVVGLEPVVVFLVGEVILLCIAAGELAVKGRDTSGHAFRLQQALLEGQLAHPWTPH